MKEPLWYHEPWAIGIFLVLFPPLGFLCLWLSAEVTFSRKCLLSLSMVLVAGACGLLEWYHSTFTSSYVVLMSSAYRSVGRAFGRDEQFAKAEKSFRKALALDPEEALNHTDMAICLYDQKRLTEAKRYFATGRNLVENKRRSRAYVRSTLGLVDILLDEGKHKVAQTLLDELMVESNVPFATMPRYRVARARIFMGRRDFQQARNELRQIINEFHSDWLGRAYERLSELSALEGKKKKELYFLCESLRYREGDKELEQKILQCAKRKGEKSAPFKAYIKAMRYRRKSMAGESTARVLLGIVEEYPGFIFADGCIYTAAYCYFAHEEDYHKAYKLYERVAKEYPKSESVGKALWQAASCYKKIGLPRHREQALKRMLVVLDSSDTLRDRARFALKRDQWREARRARNEREK